MSATEGRPSEATETTPAPIFPAPLEKIPSGKTWLPTLVTGQRVDDYEILRLLGSGGFARVYLARQLSLERLVALKVSAGPAGEARTLARLEHSHIVQVFSESTDPQRNLRLLCESSPAWRERVETRLGKAAATQQSASQPENR